MNLERLFKDRDYLERELRFFISKKQIRIINDNKELALSHIKKARHNLGFYKSNKQKGEFDDWLIVILYYVLYHSALALVVNKKYSSKNHYATILILIKEYAVEKSEVELLDELALKKEDAELYTNLKEDRNHASYTADTRFNPQKINEYENKVIDFINKAENILGD